jgi:acyl-coenzyme A synthetase/AMP-(fatty) acid ligase
MRGYWGRPDLDDRVFERRPIGDGLDDVFLRTGDLVRETLPGVFEFLGRRDRQIKSRGYRVELGEVEAALLRHESVRDAAVFAVPDGQGSHVIEATAVPVQDHAVTAEALLDHLRAALPAYAVPTRVELRVELPRTSTGKADRVALRAQAIARIDTVAETAAEGEGAIAS